MRGNVVIVGGGPAGSACALELARRGIDVALVERQRFPRRKVCGEYLNGGAVAALDALGLGDAVRRIARPLRGIRLVPPGTDAIELPFPTAALACERAVLDELLFEAARAAGAVVLRGQAEDLAFDGARVCGAIVRDDAGERRTLGARFVVGADGAGSLVARKLGLALAPRGVRRFAVGGHYEGFGALDGHVEMYVGTGAYFAINPLDDARSNVMVVVRDRDLAAWSGAVDEGMRGKAADLGRGHRSFANARRIGARVSVGPLAFDVRAVARAGALLVGDAAGFLNPFTGQGVFLALSGARDAAATIATALDDRALESRAFAGYAERRTRDFRIRRRLTKLVDVLVDVPPLARRATSRLRARPEIAATPARRARGNDRPRTRARAGTCGETARMTEMTNEIEIAASAETIYAFASATERWPEILPHYRYVRVLEDGPVRLLAMAAWRDIFPISWVARQTNDPHAPAIYFQHVRGWTRGMHVAWRFAPTPRGTRVTIEHRLDFAFPIAAAWLGKHVVGDFFVHDVATKTLARMKSLAEAAP